MKRIVNKLDVVVIIICFIGLIASAIDAMFSFLNISPSLDIPQKYYNFLTFCGFLIAYINLAVKEVEEEPNNQDN